MKKNLRDILIFLGLSMDRFFPILLIHFLFLCLSLAAATFTFYLFLKTKITFPMTMSAVCLFFTGLQLALARIMVRKTAILDVLHFKHVSGHSSETESLDREELKRKESGIRDILIGRKIRLRLPVLIRTLAIPGILPVSSSWLSRLTPHSLRKAVVSHVVKRIAAFGLVLLPFGLVSLVLTVGLVAPLRIFVFVLGFLFVWFLYGALAIPILRLDFQQTIWREYFLTPGKHIATGTGD